MSDDPYQQWPPFTTQRTMGTPAPEAMPPRISLRKRLYDLYNRYMDYSTSRRSGLFANFQFALVALHVLVFVVTAMTLLVYYGQNHPVVLIELGMCAVSSIIAFIIHAADY